MKCNQCSFDPQEMHQKWKKLTENTNQLEAKLNLFKNKLSYWTNLVSKN